MKVHQLISYLWDHFPEELDPEVSIQLDGKRYDTDFVMYGSTNPVSVVIVGKKKAEKLEFQKRCNCPDCVEPTLR